MRKGVYHSGLPMVVKVKSIQVVLMYRRNAGQRICKMKEMCVLKME